MMMLNRQTRERERERERETKTRDPRPGKTTRPDTPEIKQQTDSVEIQISIKFLIIIKFNVGYTSNVYTLSPLSMIPTDLYRTIA
jgi:hypothetical protein